MIWTWDQTTITHDQTCWTYDGHTTCRKGGVGADRKRRHLTGQTVFPDRTEAIREKARRELELRQGIERAYDGEPEVPIEIEAAIEVMPTEQLRELIRDDDAIAVIVVLLLA